MQYVQKLGLGTVQWGVPYGVSNQHGITAPETVRNILGEAKACGVVVLDTASLYGESESVLGANDLSMFQVVTKTPRFGSPRITDEQAEILSQTFRQSLVRLSLQNAYGLLVHHADDLVAPGGEKLVAALNSMKESGTVEKVGVSVYDGEQLAAVLEVFRPDIVQLPLNVLDQRMLKNGWLARLRREGVETHIRSVFLQGLLLMPLERIPAYFSPIQPLLERWQKAASVQGFSLTQAALSFVRDIDEVDTVLVGVEDLQQFRSCAEDFAVPRYFDASGLACDESAFINPSQWKLQ
jgi:aryl-alcohol dehydrogenase-like predicted oxidoreductase